MLCHHWAWITRLFFILRDIQTLRFLWGDKLSVGSFSSTRQSVREVRVVDENGEQLGIMPLEKPLELPRIGTWTSWRLHHGTTARLPHHGLWQIQV